MARKTKKKEKVVAHLLLGSAVTSASGKNVRHGQGWRISKSGTLSTTQKAARDERQQIERDNERKITTTGHRFRGIEGRSKLMLRADEEELQKLRTISPWELPDNVFFSPEVFYVSKDNDITVKGSIVPARPKKDLVGMPFSIDTIACRKVTPTCLVKA